MQLVILVCARNVVRSLFVKTLHTTPPALRSLKPEADTRSGGSGRRISQRLWETQHAIRSCRRRDEAPTARRTRREPHHNTTWQSTTPIRHGIHHWQSCRPSSRHSRAKRNDLLFNQVKDSLSLVTRGYVVDSKHKKIVASWRHLQHVITNPAERFTFESPSDPTRFVAEPASEEAARIALGVVSTYALRPGQAQRGHRHCEREGEGAAHSIQHRSDLLRGH